MAGACDAAGRFANRENRAASFAFRRRAPRAYRSGMRCPYCRSPLAETSPECPSCRLTLDRAIRLLGPPPPLDPGVTDRAGALPRGDAKRLTREITRLRRTFPQTDLHVLLHDFPEEHPLELHVFWLFNGSRPTAGERQGGDHHGILLALDPGRGRAALTVGYGLEPFLGDEALDHLLERAEPAWSNGDWTRGILEVLDGLARLLESAALETAAAFGLSARPGPRPSGDF
jgi:uncharacterized membrane protein YgcG